MESRESETEDDHDPLYLEDESESLNHMLFITGQCIPIILLYFFK